MSDLRLCSLSDLPPGSRRLFVVKGRQVLAMNLEGSLHAMDALCPHAGGALVEARVENGTVTCVNHGTCFDFATGKVRVDLLDEELRESIDVENLPFGPLTIFRLVVRGEDVFIDVDKVG